MIDSLTEISRDLRTLAREFVQDTGMLGSIIAVALVFGISVAILAAMVLLGILLA